MPMHSHREQSWANILKTKRQNVNDLCVCCKCAQLKANIVKKIKQQLRVHFTLELLAFCVLHINNSIHRTKATPKPPKRIQQKALRKRARRIPQEWHHDNFFLHSYLPFCAMSLKLALSRALCVCLSVHSVDLQDFFPFQFTRSPSLQNFLQKNCLQEILNKKLFWNWNRSI